MKVLTIPIKGIYFDQIKSGIKTEEYRLYNDYWKKRLISRQYDIICLTKGYPKKDDCERRLILSYKGYVIKNITHPHFGELPVKVFAIKVEINS